MEPGAAFILLILAAAVYFLPWLVAWSKRHPNTGAIFALNLLLGWTLLGWIIALVWAFARSPAADAIRRERGGRGATKKCPWCAELVQAEALVCKHCGRDIVQKQ